MMRKVLILLVMLSLTSVVNAQKPNSVQDSIGTFYDEVFGALKKHYLHRENVSWKAVMLKTRQNLLQYHSFEQSLAEIKVLFDTIGANHCLVYHQGKKYAATGNQIPASAYSEQWKKKYLTKPAFEAKMLNEDYAYILIPGMVFFDLSSEKIQRMAQPMYDQINQLRKNRQPKGWIIDLRLNTGGHSAPMLLALYDFLGNQVVYHSVNAQQKERVALRDGKYLSNKFVLSEIHPSGDLLEQAKVAVIIGPATASSGEVTALAFKGRPNTVFIGTPTAGFTTGNIAYPLPFGATLALTTTYNGDRNEKYHNRIEPDIVVTRQDDFDQLLLDKNVIEAMKFLSK